MHEAVTKAHHPTFPELLPVLRSFPGYHLQPRQACRGRLPFVFFSAERTFLLSAAPCCQFSSCVAYRSRGSVVYEPMWRGILAFPFVFLFFSFSCCCCCCLRNLRTYSPRMLACPIVLSAFGSCRPSHLPLPLLLIRPQHGAALSTLRPEACACRSLLCAEESSGHGRRASLLLCANRPTNQQNDVVARKESARVTRCNCQTETSLVFFFFFKNKFRRFL